MSLRAKKGHIMRFRSAQVVMTWEAKDLKGMPVKMETSTPEGKMTMQFKDIKTDKPADSLFDPPAGYTKHASMQEMMMAP